MIKIYSCGKKSGINEEINESNRAHFRPNDSEGDRTHVGEAVASAIRDMALRHCGQLTRPEGRFD